MGAPDWTNAEVEKLTCLYDAGLSGGEIARRLNRSRSAILGKLSRLNMVGRRPVTRLANPGNVGNFGPRKPLPVPKPVVPSEAPESKGLGMMALSDSVCRYPINDGVPEYLFCGGAVLEKSTYCIFHNSRCRVKVTGKYK